MTITASITNSQNKISKMTKTRLQELIEINQADFNQTHEHVDKIMLFYTNLRVRLSNFFGITQSNPIKFIGGGMKETVSLRIQDAVRVSHQGTFSCSYLIQIDSNGMNTDRCGINFAESNFSPFSGIILTFCIKYFDGTFEVNAPAIGGNGDHINTSGKKFEILENAGNDAYENLLNTCWDCAKLIVRRDLKHRFDNVGTTRLEGGGIRGFRIPTPEC